MARNLVKELDALMKADLEQSETFQTMMRKRGGDDEWVGAAELLPLLVDWLGAHRLAILRLAEEIDRLNRADEPKS